ncbi:hypothetical protein OEZ71_19240 [Defluviimonas sp. WL0050]|uniref:Uncharacterized protein n=1 Tax=Albidovulum litorale TaxID=2984134 RepID=A0ABT2ZTU5_9RHOB|nr:hypothetical protein [Defluviimonas sp. WL0050]MCV2874439.1 hypothetical protein [Defluviimonas sp. WL0050]
MCFDVNPLAQDLYLQELNRDPRAGYDHADAPLTGWRAERLRALLEGGKRVRRRGGLWTPVIATS